MLACSLTWGPREQTLKNSKETGETPILISKEDLQYSAGPGIGNALFVEM